MTAMHWTNDVETTHTEVRFTSPELFGAAADALIDEGYEIQDGDGISFGHVHVGHVFAKFTPWNIAYDFVILSVLPGLEV